MGPTSWEFEGDRLYDEAKACYEKSLKKKKRRKVGCMNIWQREPYKQPSEKSIEQKNDRREQSCRLFERAGHTYQRAECWGKAGTSFEKAANIYIEITQREVDAASNFLEAAICFKKTNDRRSLELFEKSIDIYVSVGRRALAAKQLEKVADMYENQEKIPAKAMEAYRKAGDLYENEESPSTASKCYLKVAHLAVETKEYEIALKYFTIVGMKAAQNPLLKFGAKEYFLKAILTALVIDHVRATNELGTFTDAFKEVFGQSREQAFCEKAILCVEKADLTEFQSIVKKFNKYSKLDHWTRSLTSKIESIIEVMSEKPSRRSSTVMKAEEQPEVVKTRRSHKTLKEEPKKTHKISFDEDDLF